MNKEDSLLIKAFKEMGITLVELNSVNKLKKMGEEYQKDSIQEYKGLKVGHTYGNRTIELIKPDGYIHWKDKFGSGACSYKRFIYVCNH